MLDRVRANWPLKLLAIALAFAIWVSVTGENHIVQDFRVPLEVRLDDDRVLASAPPNTVTVRLRGAESLMRRLDPVPIVLRVEVAEAAFGEQDVQLTPDDLGGVPRGVEVDFIDPDRVRLSVDQRERREISIEPTFLGQPADGFAFYGASVAPESLIVEGPLSVMAEMTVLRTNPIRLDQRTAPFVARVGVVPESTLVHIRDNRAPEVRVFVDAAAVEKQVNGVRVTVSGSSFSTSAQPARLDLVFAGPPQIVDRLTPERVRLVADAGGLQPSAEPQNVDVRVDFVDISAEEQARISVKSISRRTVDVLVTLRGSGG